VRKRCGWGTESTAISAHIDGGVRILSLLGHHQMAGFRGALIAPFLFFLLVLSSEAGVRIVEGCTIRPSEKGH